MTEDEVCAICRDPQRATGVLCVVEAPLNVWAIERTGVFRGHYHVLMGVLSPLHGVGPEQLRVRELMDRLRSGQYHEVVLALNPTVEGGGDVHVLGGSAEAPGPADHTTGGRASDGGRHRICR
jgi:recombination protein RecR